MEAFQDESGLFGIAGHRDAAYQAYLGLHAMQHRGTTGAGIVCSDGHMLRARYGRGLVQAVFADPGLQELRGVMAVGQVQGGPEPSERRPVLARYALGQVALAMAGRFANGARLRKELKQEGHLFTTLTDAELLLQLVAASSQRTFVNRLVDALWKVEGAFSLVAATEDRLIAVRDPFGFRPLVLGQVEGAVVVATEDGPIHLLGGEVVRDIEPGEMLIVDADGSRSVAPFLQRGRARCVQEYVGVARADATVDSRPVYPVRLALGEQLSQEQPCSVGQVVVGLPDAGLPAAIGYARASGVPFQHGLLRADATTRPLIEPPGEIRGFGARLRWHPVPAVVAGRRVVFVVNAVGTGDDVRRAVQLLERAGAVEVHLRVASPPTRGACPYGLTSPADEELVANRAPTLERVGTELGVTSIGFLSVEGLVDVLGRPQTDGEGWCVGCCTGQYPVRPEEPDDQLPLFDPANHPGSSETADASAAPEGVPPEAPEPATDRRSP